MSTFDERGVATEHGAANTKWEFPRLCRGGSQTLRVPGVFHAQLLLFCSGWWWTKVLLLQLLLLFTGCGQAPLRGQQP